MFIQGMYSIFATIVLFLIIVQRFKCIRSIQINHTLLSYSLPLDTVLRALS